MRSGHGIGPKNDHNCQKVPEVRTDTYFQRPALRPDAAHSAGIKIREQRK